jgi:hypothetical protein
MRTMSVLTVLILAGLLFVYGTDSRWRESKDGLAMLLVIGAVVAAVGSSLAIRTGRRARKRKTR